VVAMAGGLGAGEGTPMRKGTHGHATRGRQRSRRLIGLSDVAPTGCAMGSRRSRDWGTQGGGPTSGAGNRGVSLASGPHSTLAGRVD
jgi:hypothetical protein